MNRSTRRQLSLLTSLFSLIAIGIYYINVNKPSVKPSECEITNKTCVFRDNKTVFSINFLQEPEVEEELQIKFVTSGDVKIVNAWIEGVNMYMGKTPIIFEQTPSVGITFLGSCNLPEMKWRINIEAQNNEGEINHYSAFFYTYL
jgi:hypothetical protein